MFCVVELFHLLFNLFLDAIVDELLRLHRLTPHGCECFRSVKLLLKAGHNYIAALLSCQLHLLRAHISLTTRAITIGLTWIKVVFIPKTFCELFVLAVIEKCLLLLLLSNVQTLLQTIMPVEVSLEVLRIFDIILILLLEALEYGSILDGLLRYQRNALLFELVIDILLSDLFIDALFPAVNSLFDTSQHLGLVSVRDIMQTVQVDQLSIIEVRFCWASVCNDLLCFLFHFLQLWHLNQDLLHLFLRETFEQFMILCLHE